MSEKYKVYATIGLLIMHNSMTLDTFGWGRKTADDYEILVEWFIYKLQQTGISRGLSYIQLMVV